MASSSDGSRKPLGFAAALAVTSGVLLWLRRQQKQRSVQGKSLGEFKVKGLDVDEFCAAVERKIAGMKFRCKPFLVGWYNAKREETGAGSQKIEAADDALAIIMYTVPGYLDVVASHFGHQKPKAGFVDDATKVLIDSLTQELDAEFGAIVVNTDQGPPYYHVQTIGAVSGVDQHVEPTEINDKEWEEELSDELELTRDPKIWGTDKEMRRKIFGVNIHPEYGGWYAFRVLLILPKVIVPHRKLQQPSACDFLSDDQKRRILWEYNVSHQECRWRDLNLDNHPPEKRYSPEEFFFFTEQNQEKRRRFLELKAQAGSTYM